MWDFGLRIAKRGTRPKGGSPQDNLRLRSQPFDRLRTGSQNPEFRR